MFGGLRVVQSDRTITRFQTQKTGILLAYLALYKNAPHSREVLAEMLWPGADPLAVRNRLNQAASSLRRQLEPPGTVHGSVLVTDQRSIRLNPDSIDTDIEEFVRCVSRAETAATNEDKQLLLKQAIDLYVGDFLSGFYAEWLTLEQLRLGDLYSGALFDLLDVSRDLGDVDQSIRAATLLLKDDPTDEGTHCDLMRLYIDAGRPAAAKRQFEELARILANEHETPSDEAYELNREATAKRTSHPKPIQVVIKHASPGPVITDDAVPGLPSPLNRFLGREADLLRVSEMLLEPSTRLVTILGIGGCGKTRLALQLAHAFTNSRQYAAFFVALADLRDPQQILEQIAVSIGIRDTENVARRLRQSERTLLVLDNIEHLLAEGSGSLLPLLEEVPGLKIIVTSRCPIKMEGERCYLLAPLPAPSESAALDELSKNPCVALFVDRAQAALPDFQLTSRNADVVRRLCQRLDGLPLAIELAASWSKTVAPSQMLAMLNDRFSLLESRRRDISSRHRTMRAVIDSSVDLLTPDVRVLFNRLSVFQGGWTLESASFVCQRPDVLHAMDALAEQSLIQSEGSDGESLRFRMLDILRDYAGEHVPSADRAETSNLHAEYFSHLAEQASTYLRSSNQATWLNRLDTEISNLAAAFHWYIEHELVESALRMANHLAAYWEFRGRTTEGRRWMEVGLEKVSSESDADPRVVAEARTHLARLIWVRGDFSEAVKWHERCLADWMEIADSRGIAYAQLNIQMEAHRTRDYKRSVELLQDNLQRATDIGDKDLIARSLLALGNTSVELRRFDEAREYYERSLHVARDAGNVHRAAVSLNNLGNLALLSKQFDHARLSLQQALEQFEALKAKSLATETMVLLAKLHRKENDAQSATLWLERAWAQSPEETYHVQSLFHEYAHSFSERGNLAVAATLLGFVNRQCEASGSLNYDIEQEELDQLTEKLLEGLGKGKFEEAWAIGRTLDIGQAAQRIFV